MNNYYKPLKIIFAGTPNFSAYHLKYLISSHHTILSILIQPDRPNQRNKKIVPSPVRQIAQYYKIPIIQVENFNNEKKIKKILPKTADVIIIVAFGIILPKFLLNLFPMGCINIHASLLPRWRGSSPIQQAILNNDKITGITAIKINQKIDSGIILYQIPYIIDPKETTITLTNKLCIIGIKVLFQTLIKIQKEKYTSIKQNPLKITYAKKLKNNIGKINFHFHAKKIENMIRALNPWPGIYIILDNVRIKLHQVEVIQSNKKWSIGEVVLINSNGIFIQTKKNILKIKKLQIPGKKILNISEFINSKQKFFINKKIL